MRVFFFDISKNMSPIINLSLTLTINHALLIYKFIIWFKWQYSLPWLRFKIPKPKKSSLFKGTMNYLRSVLCSEIKPKTPSSSSSDNHSHVCKNIPEIALFMKTKCVTSKCRQNQLLLLHLLVKFIKIKRELSLAT